MSSSWLRSDGSSLSISTMISTSCVMLENLQEFNATNNACEFNFSGYSQPQHSDENPLQTSNVRENTADDLAFESEATPFSQDSYPGPRAPLAIATERSTYDVNNSVHLTSFPSQNEYTPEVSRPTFLNATCNGFKENINASYTNKVIPQPNEETFFNNNDGADRLENCYEFRFQTIMSGNEIISRTRHTKGDPPCQMNIVAESSDIVDPSDIVRHEVIEDDVWSVGKSNYGTNFETTNPTRGRLWGGDTQVPLVSSYEGVHERDEECSFATHGRQGNGSQYLQKQENEYENSQWLPANTCLHKQVKNSNCANSSSSEMKEGCDYDCFREPTAMTDTHSERKGSTVPLVYADPVHNHVGSPLDESVRQSSKNCGQLNFLSETQSARHVSPDNLKSLQISKSYDHPMCDNSNIDNHRSSENFDDQRAENHMETFNKESMFYSSHNSKNIDVNETNIQDPNSLAGFESEHSETEIKQQGQTSSKQTPATWSIDSIQNELELLEDRRRKIGGPVNTIQQQLESYKIQNKAKKESSGLVDVDYMICSGVTVAGFKPRAIIRKRGKVNIPSDIKDQGYWQKRRKNNDSARKSRELKKEKEKNFYRRALELEYENVYLHECLSLAEAELASVGRRIPAPPMSSLRIY